MERLILESERSGTKQVEFVCHAPEAKAVFLAGTFNGWSPTDEPMAGNKRGEWRTTLSLRPGRYEYKFVVDGHWVCDPSCPDRPEHRCPVCVTNAVGTMNKVMMVV
jgi:1,4-alpha-glucan branching enzyme